MNNEYGGRSDEELLSEFLAGSERAFKILMTRHEQRLFAAAVKITGSRPDALDAVQEAFITAFRRASTFRGESAFGTWLYRIAINTSKDLIRKRRDEPLGDIPEQRSPAAGIDDAVALRTDLSVALQQLPEEYREAVVMHDIGGIPYEEIARLCDVRIGTVKSRISRGRRRLAEAMELHPRDISSKDRI